MTNSDCSSAEAVWSFARTRQSEDRDEFDPYEIDWQLDELPSEFRLEFDRRIRTGLGLIRALRGFASEEFEPSNSDPIRPAVALLIATLACDILGYFFNTGFYYVSLIPLALTVVVFLEGVLGQQAAYIRKQQLKIHVLDLRTRWLEVGFAAEDFEAASHTMCNRIEFNDKAHEIFKPWWGRLSLQQLCVVRSLAKLPHLAQLPHGWDLD